jgi:hypothetical protein
VNDCSLRTEEGSLNIVGDGPSPQPVSSKSYWGWTNKALCFLIRSFSLGSASISETRSVTRALISDKGSS